MKRILIILLGAALLLSGCTGMVPAASSESSGMAQEKNTAVEPPTVSEQDTEAKSTDNPAGATSTEESTAAPSREYSPNTILLHECNDFSFLLQKGEMTAEGNNAYVFEPGISEGDRERFIACQEQLLGELNAQENYRFFLSETYVDRADPANTAAFYVASSVHTWKQVLTTLQLLEGDDLLYGYAYAHANAVAARLGWESDTFEEVTEEEVEKLLAEDPGRLNLVYPCFIEPYSDARQIDLAKTLAAALYQEIGGEKTEAAFAKQIRKYVDSTGMPFSETTIRFAYGGLTVPLVIRTQYVEEWITPELQKDFAYQGSEGPVPDEMNWQVNITEMIRIREVTDQSIQYVRKALGFDDPNRKVIIWYQFKTGDPERGKTDLNDDTIQVSCAYVIAHEYVHYISRHVVPNYRTRVYWCWEALAIYYSQKLEYEEHLIYDAEARKNQQSYEEYLKETTEYVLGRMRAMKLSPTEILYSSGERGTGYAGSYYLIGQNLAEEYGEEVFSKLMLFPEDAEELVGKTLDEVIAEWDRMVIEEW